MNCRQGDIALVVKPGRECRNVGKVVGIRKWIGAGQIVGRWIGPGWLCESLSRSGLHTPDGTVGERLFQDSMLLPVWRAGQGIEEKRAAGALR